MNFHQHWRRQQPVSKTCGIRHHAKDWDCDVLHQQLNETFTEQEWRAYPLEGACRREVKSCINNIISNISFPSPKFLSTSSFILPRPLCNVASQDWVVIHFSRRHGRMALRDDGKVLPSEESFNYWTVRSLLTFFWAGASCAGSISRPSVPVPRWRLT